MGVEEFLDTRKYVYILLGIERKKNCNLSKLRYVVIASINKVVVPCYSNIVEWKSIWIELIIIGEI